MAEGKQDLAEDISSVAKPAVEHWASKDFASGGIDDDKPLLGFLDEPKDQATSENTIPLSPQWLYAKPAESKTGTFTTSGDTRPPTSFPQGASSDLIQKDAWRLDGSQDKKDWRRNVPEVENARRWREEERDTGLLGRRDRKKESDRENEFRKNDRRSDNTSIREGADSRALSASDRWHEVTGRSLGHENRRDSKWSSRWGPEDKENDIRAEKKVDAEKEEPHVDKQSVLGSNRPLPESDSRDKWRPRHRQEGHSGGLAAHRAAPGFGTERGRVEGSNAGFAPGRGRSNFKLFSGDPIGAVPSPSVNNSPLPGEMFQYPRGKLLDMYRKHRIQATLDTTPECFEEVPQITQLDIIAPLAFVKPDQAEEVVLEDIRKAKVISSEVPYDSSKSRFTRVDDYGIEPQSGVRECKAKVDVLSNKTDPGGTSLTAAKGDAFYGMTSGLAYSEEKLDQNKMESSNNHPLKEFQMDGTFVVVNSEDSFDVTTKLPDDSNSLFGASSIRKITDTIYHPTTNSETQLTDQVTPAELSLFYLDPQGHTQGPFLIEDIVCWYDEGFFGTDLPVRLSDVPEGMPFRPLGEVMQELTLRSPSNPNNSGEQYEPLSNSRRNPEVDNSVSISNAFMINDHQRMPSESDGSFSRQVQSRIAEHDVSVGSHEKLPPCNQEISGVLPSAERQNYNDLSGQDAEEVLYVGRSAPSRMHNPLGKLANDYHDLSWTPSARQNMMSETGKANSGSHTFSIENNINPLGLSWSELEGAHQKGPLSSNIPGLGDHGHLMNPLVGEASTFRHKQETFSLKGDSVHDAWSNNVRRNNSSNILQDVMDADQLARFESDSSHFNLEHMLSQHFQKQQLQKQHLLSSHQSMHLAGPFLDQLQGNASTLNPAHHQQMIDPSITDMEHTLKLQFQQRYLQQLEQQQKLQQKQKLQQQQELHHQMQLLQQQQQKQQQQHQQQQRQLLLEQLMHQQLHDPSSRLTHIEPLHGENALNEVYRQRVLHELQQQAHLIPRDHDLSLDQLIQAKFGHNPHHDHQNEFLDALSHHSHRNTFPVERILLSLEHEQLQARQIPFSSRQHHNMEEIWPFEETGQFSGAPASLHRTNSSRHGQLDFIQPQERASSFDHPGQFEQNFGLHERMQRGNYDLNSQPFERSAGTPRPNMDVLSTLARFQGMDLQEHHTQMYFSGLSGQFPSSSHSRQSWMPNQFPGSHLDVVERSWLEPNEQSQNSLMESQFTHLHHLAEKQKRGMITNMHLEDQARWSGNSENPNNGLADLLHKKMVLQSLQPLRFDAAAAPTPTYENRDPSWPFSLPSKESSFSSSADKVNLGGTFVDDSVNPKRGLSSQEQLVDVNMEAQATSFGSVGTSAFQSSSGNPNLHKYLYSDIGEIDRGQLADFMAGDVARDSMAFSDEKEGTRRKQHGSKGISVHRPILDSLEGGVEQAESAMKDHRAPKIKGPSRHSSFGSTGASLYIYETETDAECIKEGSIDRVSGNFSRGADSSSSKRTRDPHIFPSQGSSSGLIPAPSMKGKNSFPYSEGTEGRQDNAVQVSEALSSRKDTRFHRTSSYSETDMQEASFIDMLKGTRKSMGEADASNAESTDAGIGGKSIKKKGKKGRQIDPSLLGFKVHSNRMLMGEIHRPDD